MLRQFLTLSMTSLFWATQASVFYQTAQASSDMPLNLAEPQGLSVEEAPAGVPDIFQEVFQASEESSGEPDAFNAYRLGAGDSLFVNVFRFPDLSFQGTIDPAGNVLVPLVGALPLAGLTLEEAKANIQTALDRFVIQPQIDLILVGQRPVSVTIVGEVMRPGFYPLQLPQLTTALMAAGGTRGQADLRSVRVQRSMANGAVIDREVDLYTPFSQGQNLPDVQLRDGDTIVIPSRTSDEGYDRSLVAQSTLSQQQIRIRIMNYAAGGGGAMGSLALPSGSRFLDALTAMSIDLKSADIRNVGLVRFDQQQQKAITQELDGRKAMLGDATQDPMLENNDVIVIGRNWVAQITHALNTFTQPFRDVLGFLLFFQSLGNSAANLFGPSERSNSR